MTLNDLLAQIETLSDADKRTLIEKTRQLLAAGNGSGSAKRVAETALADAYVVERSAPADDPAADDPYLAALRAKIQADFARPAPTPDKMLKRGLLRGMVFDEEDFRLAEWRPTEEQLRGEA